MPEYKVGDRVRFTLEGTIRETSYGLEPWANIDYKDAYDEGTLGGSTEHAAYVPLAALELIPEPVKVGDLVTVEILDALPCGSVVSGAGGLVAQKITLGWYPTSGGTLSASQLANVWHATVLRIGDGK